MGGRGKMKNFARAAPRREEGDKGAGGERPTPCPPHLKTGDDSYGFK